MIDSLDRSKHRLHTNDISQSIRTHLGDGLGHRVADGELHRGEPRRLLLEGHEALVGQPRDGLPLDALPVLCGRFILLFLLPFTFIYIYILYYIYIFFGLGVGVYVYDSVWGKLN